MTFWHFLNCSALTFGPSYIIYKNTKLSEFRAIGTCIYAGLAYVATQLLKLIIAATFLPGSDSTSFDLLHEIFKCILGVADVAGISFTLHSVQGSFDIKLLGIALGWGATETFLTKIAPLWIGARGLEFEWKYVQDSIDANVALLRCIGFVTAVMIYRRKILPNLSADMRAQAQQYHRMAIAVLAVYTVLPSILSYFRLAHSADEWYLLAVQFIVASVLYYVISKTSDSWQKNIVL